MMIAKRGHWRPRHAMPDGLVDYAKLFALAAFPMFSVGAALWALETSWGYR